MLTNGDGGQECGVQMQMSADIGGARDGQRGVQVIDTDPRYVQADIETGQHLSTSF